MRRRAALSCRFPVRDSRCRYLADALDVLRGEGFPVTDELAAHLTPAQHDHINFYGTYSFDIEAELRREGHRPLRTTA
jgi:hypothetical protein